jgi:hypothetical protein
VIGFAGLDLPVTAADYLQHPNDSEAWELGKFTVPVAVVVEVAPSGLVSHPAPLMLSVSMLYSFPIVKVEPAVVNVGEAVFRSEASVEMQKPPDVAAAVADSVVPVVVVVAEFFPVGVVELNPADGAVQAPTIEPANGLLV